MNKKYMIFGGVILIISAVFALFLFSFRFKKDNISDFKIKDRHLRVEIVADPEAKQKGLGGRESLCEDCGMLFVFPEKGKTSFWMKGMNFDLDMVWITDSKISHISKNIDHTSLEKISPEVPSDMVLELNAGFCDRYGIQSGDEALLE